MKLEFDIVSVQQKTFSFEVDLLTKRKVSWYGYFAKNNYKRTQGENKYGW